MKVLVYGGCHAGVLADTLQQFASGWHRFDSLRNYELIDRGEPFPYHRLDGYDAIVYSPVRNKGEWNTSHLLERCAKLGLPALSYPWLQWNGYFTNVTKPSDLPPHVWCLEGLLDLLASNASIDTLRREAEAGQRFTEAARPYADSSFEALRGHEAECDIQIGGFISANYQRARLFATPDHPTSALYAYVCREIAARLSLGISLPHTLAEPHHDILPILPAVGRALGLQFVSTDYMIEEPAIGPMSLDDYLVRLQSDYIAVHQTTPPARPIRSGADLPFAPNLSTVDRNAPAVLNVVHQLDFGGAFKVSVPTTIEACSRAVMEAETGRHHSVSVQSSGYNYALTPHDARELLRRWGQAQGH